MMRLSVLSVLSLLVVGGVFAGAGQAVAADCCTCTGEKNVNPKDNKKRTFGGGWLSNEAACSWFCATKVGDPSHSWQSGTSCERPTGEPPPPKVIAALQVCDKTNREKALDDKGKCDGACEQIAKTRESCVEECKHDSGCIAACSGVCDTNGCHSACTGAEHARRIAAFKVACNSRPCVACEDYVRGKHDECVGQCWDEGCKDLCHSICFSVDSARSGACNETRKNCPKRERDRDWDRAGGGRH